jgi:hypothetical protein
MISTVTFKITFESGLIVGTPFWKVAPSPMIGLHEVDKALPKA